MKTPGGFTRAELLAVVAALAATTALTVPVLSWTQGNAGVQQSMSNLYVLGQAHVLYALDWSGRQVTWVVDDLAAYGSVGGYNAQHGCSSGTDPACHPGVVAGWSCDGWLYGYWMNNAGHHWAVHPINFSGGATGFGNFRLITSNPFSNYISGRWYDPTFWAPKDTVYLERAAPLFDILCEWPTDENPPIWSSYAMSPAAMFNPQVMRANADGGFQSPWDLPSGFESPGLFQATYPDLKTQMIEHQWLQGPPAECNPVFDPYGGLFECEPFWFNHGVDSQPVTLFYDGHVRLLPNAEVFAADQQVLDQSRGLDGLWHRGTPLEEDGYFIGFGFDAVPLSHHILTTDGILGRDTLGGPTPAALDRGEGNWAMPPRPAPESLSDELPSLTAAPSAAP